MKINQPGLAEEKEETEENENESNGNAIAYCQQFKRE